MRAMVLTSYGETADFVETDLPAPAVGEGQVLVRIAASSVNTVDTMIRQMVKDLPFAPDFPAVLGMDFAGTVAEVGAGVVGYSVGDEVCGCLCGRAHGRPWI